MKRILSFTLAEVLIVVGIIGVVATLTLPNLTHSTGDTEKVAKVKKVYSNLNLAFEQAQTKYGLLDNWCVGYNGSCKARTFDRISEFLKISKICNSVHVCTIKMDNNGSGGWNYNNAAILADGTAIALDRSGIFYFVVDIDGTDKGENLPGSDVFEFGLSKTEGVSLVSTNLTTYGYVTKAAYKGFSTFDAAAWIINFGNMDYLKTSDGTTCPNETKLTSGGNHTCK